MRLQRHVYVTRSTIHGKGLFAHRGISVGEYIGTFRGPAAKRDGMYVLWIYCDDDWEGRHGKNALRYLNHAATCNAEFEDFDLYALVDIQEDDEITINYDG